MRGSLERMEFAVAETQPTQCSLRPARPNDMPAVRELVRSESLDPTQLRWQQFLVIDCDDAVVACGQLRQFRGAQELGSLVVAPEWRGRGFAGMLVEQLIQKATQPLYLECPASMADFYAGYGFTRIAWRDIPWVLKVKFGLSAIASAMFNWSLVIMHYRGTSE